MQRKQVVQTPLHVIGRAALLRRQAAEHRSPTEKVTKGLTCGAETGSSISCA